MTTTLRVSQVKGRGAGGKFNEDGKPRPGTKLRSVYDALRRGEIIPTHGLSGQLRDFYGMELSKVYKPGAIGCVGSRLVGEWEGPYFVPVERIAPDEDVVGD